MSLRVSVDCETATCIAMQWYRLYKRQLVCVSLVAIIVVVVILCHTTTMHITWLIFHHLENGAWRKNRQHNNPMPIKCNFLSTFHPIHSTNNDHIHLQRVYSTYSFWFVSSEHIPRPFTRAIRNGKMLKRAYMYNVFHLTFSLSLSHHTLCTVRVWHRIKINVQLLILTESISQDHGKWIKCGIMLIKPLAWWILIRKVYLLLPFLVSQFYAKHKAH